MNSLKIGLIALALTGLPSWATWAGSITLPPARGDQPAANARNGARGAATIDDDDKTPARSGATRSGASRGTATPKDDDDVKAPARSGATVKPPTKLDEPKTIKTIEPKVEPKTDGKVIKETPKVTETKSTETKNTTTKTDATSKTTIKTPTDLKPPKTIETKSTETKNTTTKTDTDRKTIQTPKIDQSSIPKTPVVKPKPADKATTGTTNKTTNNTTNKNTTNVNTTNKNTTNVNTTNKNTTNVNTSNKTVQNVTVVNKKVINETVVNRTVRNEEVRNVSDARRVIERRRMPDRDRPHSSFSIGLGFSDGGMTSFGIGYTEVGRHSSVSIGISYGVPAPIYRPLPPAILVARPLIVAPPPPVVIYEPVVYVEPAVVVYDPYACYPTWYRPAVVMAPPPPVVVAAPVYTTAVVTPVVVTPAPVYAPTPAVVMVDPFAAYPAWYRPNTITTATTIAPAPEPLEEEEEDFDYDPD